MTITPTTVKQPDENPYLTRHGDLAALLAKKSHFLFGPRQTGKTSWIRHALPKARVYDLLDASVYLALSQHPGRLGEELAEHRDVVVIDEIQRIPDLLNEVQRLIETRRLRFLLTGSSARKLRRRGVNLLGGRARVRYLHPLTWLELGEHFELARAIHHGTIPSMYFSDDPDADLAAYTGTYLQQEIVAEAATRNVPAFSRFLRVAALFNATIVNFTNLANDAQIPRTTVYEYFEILKDTLLLHEVPAWRQSKSRKPLVSSKYYFFDVGVVSSLQGRQVRPRTPEFGSAFETWMLHELLAYRDYESGPAISHWRSASGFEVDFVLGDEIAVEVKAKESVSRHDLRSLRAIAEEKAIRRCICVSLERRERTVDGLRLMPYEAFLRELWAGRIR